MKIEIPQELMESIKKHIAEYEKENQKPKDVIDYENGWVVDLNRVAKIKQYNNVHIYGLYSTGLYRDTQEEAEKLLRKMQIEHRLKQWAKMCKEKVDWKDEEQEKMCVFINSFNKQIKILKTYISMQNDVYFTDESILQRAIDDIGEQNLIDNYFVEV